ncbi:MAG TPA: gamma-glutamylcyclotransferase family protein [Candidatus Binataceae bacterium]|nr:gamma-glutamylcyclotransferase family protein [Candidatus Binataceae bacterium]
MDKPDEESTLFVYGSLIDPARRVQVIGHEVPTMAATLHDYERGRLRYFFIRRRPGIDTPGLLLLNLKPEDFVALDRYEELPRLYSREKIEVLGDDGNPIRCWAYIPTQFTLNGGE